MEGYYKCVYEDTDILCRHIRCKMEQRSKEKKF